MGGGGVQKDGTAERAPEEKICCGISERERETKKNREERLVVFCPGRKKEIKKESKKKEATVIEKRTIVGEVNGGRADAAEDG